MTFIYKQVFTNIGKFILEERFYGVETCYMFILICYESGRKTDYSKGLILINYDAV